MRVSIDSGETSLRWNEALSFVRAYCVYTLLENAKEKMNEIKRFDTICVGFVSHRFIVSLQALDVVVVAPFLRSALMVCHLLDMGSDQRRPSP